MKAFRSPHTADRATRRPQLTIDRPVIVLCMLLLLLMIGAVGCDIATDLPSTTTVAETDSTSMTVALQTTSTLAPTTSTTLAPTTSTTLAEETTSTVEATSTTETTSTTFAPATTSTTTSTLATTPSTLVTAGAAQQPAGTVLYEISDWSSGVSGWAAAGQWKTAAGMLVTDGSSDSFAVAPVDLTGHADYVVECEAQIIDPKAGTDVILMARMINGQGYYGGFDGSASRMAVGYGSNELGGANFVLDGDWHKYRLEVRGNMFKLFLEQAEVARAVDNRALDAGTVGIYCAHGQINVRSFRVVAL